MLQVLKKKNSKVWGKTISYQLKQKVIANLYLTMFRLKHFCSNDFETFLSNALLGEMLSLLKQHNCSWDFFPSLQQVRRTQAAKTKSQFMSNTRKKFDKSPTFQSKQPKQEMVGLLSLSSGAVGRHSVARSLLNTIVLNILALLPLAVL